MPALATRGVVAVVDRTRTRGETTMNDAIESSGSRGRSRRGGLLALICLALLTSAIAVAPGSASASSGILEFGMAPTTTQAGGHPNVTMFVHYLNRNNPPSETCFCDDVKTI